MPTNESKLAELVREVVNDQPTNHCADEGTTCIFCGANYDYNAVLSKKPIVVHGADCWLNRAAEALRAFDEKVE